VNSSLNGLLKSYFEEKYISDFKCSCGDFGILQSIYLKNLPIYLNIYISRFTNQLKKIMAYLKYEQEITLMKIPYILSGVLIHQGSLIQCGHYYSYVNSEKKWFKINDSAVKEISVDEMMESKESTCMLLYEKKILKYKSFDQSFEN